MEPKRLPAETTTPKTRFEYRHQYDDRADALERAATDIDFTGEESLTQQQFAEDADLNKVLARWGITDGSALPPAAIDPSYYGDFSSTIDYRQALDRIRDAKEKFEQLPAKLRKRFNNNPADLWEFVDNPDNVDEAIELGLLHRSIVEPPIKTAPTPATPPAPEPTQTP